MNRAGENLEAVGNGGCFLASDEALYITGFDLLIDGGIYWKLDG